MKQGSAQLPRTSAELDVLRAKARELASQYDAITERRGRLGQERLNARARGDLSMVQDYDATIAEMGTQMRALQREQMATEEIIRRAVESGVQSNSAGETQVITLPSGETFGIGTDHTTLLPPRDQTDLHMRYQRMMLVEAAGFILLAAIVARWAWQRGTRRAPSLGASGEISGLRTSVEAIAIEVERISENQRYVTKLLTEGAATSLAKQSSEAIAREQHDRR